MKQNYNYFIIVIISIFSLNSVSQASFSSSESSVIESSKDLIEDFINVTEAAGIDPSKSLFEIRDEHGIKICGLARTTCVEAHEMLKKDDPHIFGELPIQFFDILREKKESVAVDLLAKCRKLPKEIPSLLLFYALCLDLINVVQYIIEKFGEALIKNTVTFFNLDKKAFTMLDMATLCGSEKVVQYLSSKAPLSTIIHREALLHEIANGYNHNKLPRCLALALHPNNAACLKSLIINGSINNLSPKFFHYIIESLDDCEDLIDEVLNRDPKLLNAQYDDGNTPFMIAIRKTEKKQ